MVVDGKEILNDEELQAIINKERHRAISLLRIRLGIPITVAIQMVNNTIVELGIGKHPVGIGLAPYNEDYKP